MLRAVQQYRKKPAVVSAIQWTGTNVRDVKDFVGDEAIFDKRGVLYIATWEGAHEATEGDYIIRGVKGEFYPCKPDVFAETYELVG